MNRASFHQLLKADSLYRWHKPGEGLLLLGKNKDFTRDFSKYVLLPAFDEGIFSFFVLGEDSFEGLEIDKYSGRVISIGLDEISELSIETIYNKIDSLLSSKPLALILTLPTYERTFFSQQEKIVIRKVIQQVVLWLESNAKLDVLEKTYSGAIYLDHPEKYISKEQSGLISQINDLKGKNYCTGFHYYTIPSAVDGNAGLLRLFDEQSFILMLNKDLKRNVGVFNLFRNKSIETTSFLTKILSAILPCPRTLIREQSI